MGKAPKGPSTAGSIAEAAWAGAVERAVASARPCTAARGPTPALNTRAYGPAGPDWVREIKYDGYRLQVRRDGDTGRLQRCSDPT
jgi:ATP-dependent DNA ligase